MRRGQTVLTVVVILTSVILVWAFLGGIINQQATLATETTALEQFFLNNINLAIGVAVLFFAIIGFRQVLGGPA